MPTLNDIPPEIRALINELDLACLTDNAGWLDDGLLRYLGEEQPEPETPAWVQAAIAANPGVWMARLCRAMHGRPETYRSIVHCGACSDYSNLRRRRRSARLRATRLLPGLERLGGAHQLRPPCSQRGLTWLRHLVYRLARQGQVIIRREQRPDWRQPRGYDWMSCLYPVERRGEDDDGLFL